MSLTHIGLASLRLPEDSPIVPTVLPSGTLGTWTARLVTVVRIPIAAAGIILLTDGLRMAAVAAFALFALIDVFDGVAARRVGCDTAGRRAGDVVIDRVAIHVAALTCCLIYSTGWVVWMLLLSRDITQGILSVRFTARTKTLVIGAHWHMAYGLSMLTWGAAFILLGHPPLLMTLAAVVVSAATFWDYHRRCAQIERSFLGSGASRSAQ